MKRLAAVVLVVVCCWFSGRAQPSGSWAGTYWLDAGALSFLEIDYWTTSPDSLQPGQVFCGYFTWDGAVWNNQVMDNFGTQISSGAPVMTGNFAQFVLPEGFEMSTPGVAYPGKSFDFVDVTQGGGWFQMGGFTDGIYNGVRQVPPPGAGSGSGSGAVGGVSFPGVPSASALVDGLGGSFRVAFGLGVAAVACVLLVGFVRKGTRAK